MVEAVDYIAGLRQAADLAALPVGRRIVVIGGGMTAIDIASQTKRLGAENVTIVYRRGQAQMNASDYEQEVAQTDGVLIRHWLRPARLIAEDGRLAAIELEYTSEEGGRLIGTGASPSLGGPKPVERSTASYHAGAHTPSLSRRPAGHESIASEKGTSSAAHSWLKAPRGSLSTSIPSITGGALPRRSASRSNSSACRSTPISRRVARWRFMA